MFVQGSVPTRNVQGNLFRGSLVHVASYYGSKASLSYVGASVSHAVSVWPLAAVGVSQV